MTEQINILIAGLKAQKISFKEVIAFTDTHYAHQATAFKNGEAINEA